ncbi:MAG: hypothetical protein OFPII_10560 [Osedax symbiont Rs1]|nr:MAG: hypothetical protein OFPII_10560 [Osedax symbiont Rs1]
MICKIFKSAKIQTIVIKQIYLQKTVAAPAEGCILRPTV